MALNVKLIRLLNGEELIGELITDTENTNKIVVKNPLRVLVIPSKSTPQTPTVGFAPWMEFSDDKKFELDMSHVLCIMNPIKEFINQYNSTFGGIITPTKTPSGIIFPGS
jgi:hypothetical protein